MATPASRYVVMALLSFACAAAGCGKAQAGHSSATEGEAKTAKPAPAAPAPAAKVEKAGESAQRGEAAAENSGVSAQLSGELRSKIVTAVSEVYGLVGGKALNILEVTKSHGLWRVTFQTVGRAEPPSSVFVTADGEVAFESGFEIRRHLEKSQMDSLFVDCLKEAKVSIIGSVKTKEMRLQFREIGNFAAKVMAPCVATKEGCDAELKKLKLKARLGIQVGNDVFDGPRTRVFLETLTGCK